MDIGKIKSTGPQTVAPGTANINLNELVFDSEGVVDANASGSTISVSEAGYYLFVWEGLVVGTGDQTLYLTGSGISGADTGLEYIFFPGDALSVCQGKAVVLHCTAGAIVGLQALNSGGGNVTYLCSLGVVKVADA